MKEEIRLMPKSLAHRMFFLRRAAERAENPEFKELWENKQKELLENNS